MEWLKPITEKLNANILISAVCLTSFGCWYFSRNTALLALGSCCALYLVILFFYNCTQNYKYNKYQERKKQKALEDMVEEDNQTRLRIDIWFASLSQFHIDSLLKLMTWKSLPNASNVKIHSRDKELVSINEYEYIIPQPNYKEPIRLLFEIKNETPCSATTYFIHPYLLNLLIKYRAEHNK